MLIAALVVLGAGLGLRGSSGLGSDEVLRVNMKGPRGLLRVYCEVDRNTAFVVELCLQQEGFARSAKAVQPVYGWPDARHFAQYILRDRKIN
jgi:hypothetical protein